MLRWHSLIASNPHSSPEVALLFSLTISRCSADGSAWALVEGLGPVQQLRLVKLVVPQQPGLKHSAAELGQKQQRGELSK